MALVAHDPIQTKFLKYEDNPHYTRIEVTIIGHADNAALKAGSVLGKITASSKYTLSDADAVDGSEAAAAILLASVEASVADGDQKVAVLNLGPAIVARAGLLWHANNDAGEKVIAEAELLALGIKVEQTV